MHLIQFMRTYIIVQKFCAHNYYVLRRKLTDKQKKLYEKKKRKKKLKKKWRRQTKAIKKFAKEIKSNIFFSF